LKPNKFICTIMLGIATLSSICFATEGIKGSALPSATTGGASDTVIVIQDGVTKKLPLGNIPHNNLSGRTTATAHPTSAITGLDTALAGKEALFPNRTTLLKFGAGPTYNGVAIGGGSGHSIQDEGLDVTTRDTLNFTGAGVTVTDVAGKTTVTIPSGGGVSSFNSRTGAVSPQSSDYSSYYKDITSFNEYTSAGGGRATVDGVAAGYANKFKVDSTSKYYKWLYADNNVYFSAASKHYRDASATIKIGTTYHKYMTRDTSIEEVIDTEVCHWSAPTPDGPWTETSTAVLTKGASGKFDDVGVYAPEIQVVGTTIYLFYSGVGDVDYPNNPAATGVASAPTSTPTTFTKLNSGNAILSPTGTITDWDGLKATSFRPILMADGSWRGYYKGTSVPSGVLSGGERKRVYGYATATSGGFPLTWTKATANNPMFGHGTNGAPANRDVDDAVPFLIDGVYYLFTSLFTADRANQDGLWYKSANGVNGWIFAPEMPNIYFNDLTGTAFESWSVGFNAGMLDGRLSEITVSGASASTGEWLSTAIYPVSAVGSKITDTEDIVYTATDLTKQYRVWARQFGADRLITLPTTLPTDDETYGAGWNGDVSAPSKNAVYDKIETLSVSGLPSEGTYYKIDDTNKKFSFGTTDTTYFYQIQQDQTTDGAPASVFMTAYTGAHTNSANYSAAWSGRTARGTSSAPRRTKNGDILYVMSGRGAYAADDSSAATFNSIPSARLIIRATQDHTATGYGGEAVFQSTANDGTTQADRLIIGQDGTVTIGGGISDGVTTKTITELWTASNTGDDTAYNTSTWNGSLLPPTQNSVRDKFESLPVISSGNFTPTATSVGNLDATPIPASAQYLRVGSTVTVSGSVNINPTTTATNTTWRLTLPVASNLANNSEGAGTVSSNGALAAANVGLVRGDAATDEMFFSVYWGSSTVDATDVFYTFTYRIN